MRLIPSAECIPQNVDLSLLHCYSFLPGYILVFGFSVLLGAKTFSFTFWYQLGSEPELSEFEVKVQTYIRADLHTLRPTVSFTCVFFMSRRVLHISYTEHIILSFFFFLLFRFHKIVWEQEWSYRIQTMICVQMKLLARFENSLSTRTRSNWFGSHPTVIAVFSWVETNLTKGETAPGFKATALKNQRVWRRESWNTPKRRAAEKRYYTFQKWLCLSELTGRVIPWWPWLKQVFQVVLRLVCCIKSLLSLQPPVARSFLFFLFWWHEKLSWNAIILIATSGRCSNGSFEIHYSGTSDVSR